VCQQVRPSHSNRQTRTRENPIFFFPSTVNIIKPHYDGMDPGDSNESRLTARNLVHNIISNHAEISTHILGAHQNPKIVRRDNLHLHHDHICVKTVRFRRLVSKRNLRNVPKMLVNAGKTTPARKCPRRAENEKHQQRGEQRPDTHDSASREHANEM